MMDRFQTLLSISTCAATQRRVAELGVALLAHQPRRHEVDPSSTVLVPDPIWLNTTGFRKVAASRYAGKYSELDELLDPALVSRAAAGGVGSVNAAAVAGAGAGLGAGAGPGAEAGAGAGAGGGAGGGGAGVGDAAALASKVAGASSFSAAEEEWLAARRARWSEKKASVMWRGSPNGWITLR